MSIKIELDLKDIMNDYLADCRGSEYEVEEGTPIEGAIFHSLVMEVKDRYKDVVKDAIKEIVNSEIRERYRTLAGPILRDVLDEMINESEVKELMETRIKNIANREMKDIILKTADEALEPHLEQIKSKTKLAVKCSIKDVLSSAI